MPILTPETQKKIEHIYAVGAGKKALDMMSKISLSLPSEHPDHIALESYLKALENIKDFTGHIITTHDRLLLIGDKSHLLDGREVIVDEDIMRTILSTNSVKNKDILWAIKSNCFSYQVVKKLKSIIATVGFQRYNCRDNEKIELSEELISELENVDGNVLDLYSSCYI